MIGATFHFIQILIEFSVSKQWRPGSDAAFCGVWSGFALFAYVPGLYGLKDLSVVLNTMVGMVYFHYIKSLRISVLRNLESEACLFYIRAYKSYSAFLFAKCYFQHLLSTYINSTFIHKHTKISFINKGMEFFLDLHIIFKDDFLCSKLLCIIQKLS